MEGDSLRQRASWSIKCPRKVGVFLAAVNS